VLFGLLKKEAAATCADFLEQADSDAPTIERIFDYSLLLGYVVDLQVNYRGGAVALVFVNNFDQVTDELFTGRGLEVLLVDWVIDVFQIIGEVLLADEAEGGGGFRDIQASLFLGDLTDLLLEHLLEMLIMRIQLRLLHRLNEGGGVVLAVTVEHHIGSFRIQRFIVHRRQVESHLLHQL